VTLHQLLGLVLDLSSLPPIRLVARSPLVIFMCSVVNFREIYS